MKRNISKIFAVILVATILLTAKSSAHNYHTSLTRIDFNKEAKSLEIEINLFNHDLEKVLETKNKKQIDFDKSNELDKLIFDYLNETFLIKNADGNLLKIVWIGREIKTDMTTAFIEIDGVENIENIKLQNKIFFESFSEQINLVALHFDDKKSDLRFGVGDDFKNLEEK